MNKKEIAVPEVNEGFMKLKSFNLMDAMNDDLVGLDLDFERIKIPSGGTTMFEVPGDESSDTVSVKDFKGVILYHHPVLAFYKNKYTGGNQPPDCGSYDGLNGIGEPGGSCTTCQFNKFGSGENGSKACKARRRVYLIMEGNLIPVLLTLPTGSIREFTRYIMRLWRKGYTTSAVVTKFTLRKAVNSGGIAYSQAQFNIDRVLNSDEEALLTAMAEKVKLFSGKISYELDSADDTENPFIDTETGEILAKFR